MENVEIPKFLALYLDTFYYGSKLLLIYKERGQNLLEKKCINFQAGF